MKPEPNQLAAIVARQSKRLAEFREMGVNAKRGFNISGSIRMSASEAEKCLRLLRRLKKLKMK